MIKRIIIIATLPILLILLGELPVQAQDPTQEERIARLEEAYTHLATKEDLAKLEGVLKADIAKLEGVLKADIAKLEGELKADIATLRGELKADIVSLRGELKADIASLRGELRGMQWMLGGGFIILIAVTLWVNREKKPDPQPEPAPLSTNPQAQ